MSFVNKPFYDLPVKEKARRFDALCEVYQRTFEVWHQFAPDLPPINGLGEWITQRNRMVLSDTPSECESDILRELLERLPGILGFEQCLGFDPPGFSVDCKKRSGPTEYKEKNDSIDEDENDKLPKNMMREKPLESMYSWKKADPKLPVLEIARRVAPKYQRSENGLRKTYEAAEAKKRNERRKQEQVKRDEEHAKRGEEHHRKRRW
jgi:hypothetical protein